MNLLQWLLDTPEPAIQFQVARDLLDKPESQLHEIQNQIEKTGHGKKLFDQRNANGTWGNGAYNPKWTCTHYVLFELMQIGMPASNPEYRASTDWLLSHPIGSDGGINYARTIGTSDVCINGMILSFASYFGSSSDKLKPIIDYILHVQMADGGWNCAYTTHASHSSLHTTISVLEGITQYLSHGYTYEASALDHARCRGIAFILEHQLYKSSTTGESIKDEFFRYTFPIRWKYDILRCLDYFRAAGVAHDPRMDDGLSIIEKTRNRDGQWKAYAQAGKTYFTEEKNGTPGRWNTLRALRVLKYYGRITTGQLEGV